MSTSDQDAAALVQLAREWSEAKKSLAATRSELIFSSQDFHALGNYFHSSSYFDVAAAQMVVKRINLERTAALLDNLQSLPRRMEEIKATLMAAGIELP